MGTLRRLLVANRGEIARRIFVTCREMGIETVAVYADDDARAPFVSEADQAVPLGGRTAAETYLDQAKLLDAAARTGADAVHPGYGFGSENAGFAAAVINAGLTWVGPPPEAIAAMGDKLAAKKLMAEAGVPVLGWAELTDTGRDKDASGPAAAAERVGYPLMVKAAAGGGGRGMRVVTRPDELAQAVASARREAEGSFGDGTVFLERYLPVARHVEVQVLGDHQGNLVHCFERECSVQRRHQKVIEEAPSPAVTEELRASLGAAALAAARAIDYQSAGTVEFLLADGPATTSGSATFWFLEMNTRLQVEHPVTEAVTGLDLVRQQLLIAQGEPLAFGQDDLTLDGHAIEARLYAEDVAAGYLPSAGTVTAFDRPATPATPTARIDSGVEAGTVVPVAFDPMLAKVIVHASTRQEAASRLALVLDRTTIAGVATNRDLLVSTLRDPAFLAGATTTDLLDRIDLPAPPTGADLARLVAGAVLYRQAVHRRAAQVLRFMRPGHRNSVMPPEQVTFTVDGGDELPVSYRTGRDGTIDLWIGSSTDVVTTGRVESWAERGIDAVINGTRAFYTVVRTKAAATSGTDGDAGAGEVRWHVQGPCGRIDLVERPRFGVAGGGGTAGGRRAPMPGTVRAVQVAVGDWVETGQTLAVVEAMKMEHHVTAPGPSLVDEVRCGVGDQVGNGQVLVVLRPLGPDDNRNMEDR